eukprot:TRINITY_DN22188_c0_g1_i2.p1 TRINITY_DN22188_c0_g1~~TRINITY_DN22188_c0_g1_i2.p1  ORF type:complete len:284 (+),score=55.69 TRINITY_DN22188_c0_g1_i2:172-1023(+)
MLRGNATVLTESDDSSQHEEKVHHLSNLEAICVFWRVLEVLILRSLRQSAFAPDSSFCGSCCLGFARLCRRFRRWRQWRRRQTISYDFATFADHTCAICLGNLAEHDAADRTDGQGAEDPVVLPAISEPLLRLQCDHTFHESCITGWFDRQDTCPVCRGGSRLDNCVLLVARQQRPVSQQLSPSRAVVMAEEAASAAVATLAAERRAAAAEVAGAGVDLRQRLDLIGAEAGTGLTEPLLLATGSDRGRGSGGGEVGSGLAEPLLPAAGSDRGRWSGGGEATVG